MTDGRIQLAAIQIRQLLGEFYIASVEAPALLAIAKAEIRHFKAGNAADIAGVQRRLSRTRERQIGEYVNYEFAAFPT